MREGHSPAQMGKQGQSHHRWIVSGNRCWCGTRTARETSLHRACPRASVGCASGPQSRPPSFREDPSHGERAPRPQRPAMPGGGPAPGAPGL
jgi:hypothetical protein